MLRRGDSGLTFKPDKINYRVQDPAAQTDRLDSNQEVGGPVVQADTN